MKFSQATWALAAALVFCGAAVHAQDQPADSRAVSPTAPLPPVSSAGSNAMPAAAARGVSAPDYEEPPAEPIPDTRTLSGAELFSVGSEGTARDVFSPSFSVTTLGTTDAINSAGQQVFGTTELFGAQLNFNRTWSRYRLTATYNGGETFTQPSQPSSSFHDATVEQEIQWERWRLTLRNDFLASSGAAFGGSGMGGPGLTGQFTPISGQTANSSETIQTGEVTRYSDLALVQAEYSFSRRSAFTFSGTYGLLHFSQSGYIDSNNANFQAGYDYQLDARNSVAIIGGYSKIDYIGFNTTTGDYTTSLAYGRKVTGRLAFQVSAGPEQIHVTGGTNGNFQIWSWTALSALTYQSRRTQYSATFTRGLTNGSGVLYGSTTDTFKGSVGRQFTRYWSGSVNGGYTINGVLVPSGVPTTSLDGWFIGANVGRRIGYHAGVNLSYGLLRQNSSTACPVASCGVSGFQNTFGMTLNWHLRPE